MNPASLLVDYFVWHYSQALLDILRVWGNLMWFVGHFFSTPSLFKTFFSAWKRMYEEYPKKGNFDLEYMAGTFLVNIIMRIVGMVIRAVFILISLLGMFIVLFGGVLFVAFWIVAPIALVILFTSGLSFVLGS